MVCGPNEIIPHLKWRQTSVCFLVVCICQNIQTTKSPACSLLAFSSNICLCSSTLLFWPLILLVFAEISQETAVNPVDIVSTLQSLQMLKYWKGKHLILKRQVGSYAIKSKYKHKIAQNILMSLRRKTRPGCLSSANNQRRDKCYIQGRENSGIPSSSFCEGLTNQSHVGSSISFYSLHGHGRSSHKEGSAGPCNSFSKTSNESLKLLTSFGTKWAIWR